MSFQTLGLGKTSPISSIRSKLSNAYEQLAAGDDYQKNSRDLRIIQAAVVTVSAIATGFTNGFAHRDRIGDEASFGLAVLIVAFVERFYFVLRHGLTTVYKAGKQRFYAMFCYRAIQATMILNAMILATWIVGFHTPEWLDVWNHWSIVAHFALALLGVQAVRDSDSVVENRMLELKAATAAQDLITAQRSAAVGSPLVLIFAKVRGFFDSVSLAFRFLFRRGGWAKKFLAELNQLAADQHSAGATLPATSAGSGSAPQRPGFAPAAEAPKAQARRP